MSSCNSDKEKEPVQVRFGEFLWNTPSAKIRFYLSDDLVESIDLEYGKLSDYISLDAANYQVKVETNGKLILEKTIGFGTGESYTLYIAGIFSEEQKMNEETFNKKMHLLVEGAAAKTANGYMSQLFVQDDYFVEEPSKGKFRIVNLLPGTKPLDIEVKKGSESKFSFSGVEFVHQTKTKPLDSGESKLNIRLGNFNLDLESSKFDIEAEKLNTFYLIPEKGDYLTSSTLVKGITGK